MSDVLRLAWPAIATNFVGATKFLILEDFKSNTPGELHCTWEGEDGIVVLDRIVHSSVFVSVKPGDTITFNPELWASIYQSAFL